MFKSVFSLVRNSSALQSQFRCASNESRQSRMLQKLMSGKRKPAYKWGDPHATPKPESLFATKKTPSKLTTRRTTVLNKMFMRQVSDLIATSPVGHELCGFGLEITKVKMCQNYHGLNIFWTATATDDFDAVEAKLESISKKLRHELHQMQLMGNIPHLTFVRDHQLSYFDELDIAIAKADYGEDFVPSSAKTRLLGDFEVQKDGNEVPQISESSIEPMRQDIFGLDHALFMGRIKQSMAKSKQAWKTFEQKQLQHTPSTAKPFTLSTSFESIRQEHASEKQSEDVLRDFLQQRRLLKKLKRAEKHDEYDSRVQEEEQFRSHTDDYEEFDPTIEDDDEVEKFYDDLEPYKK